MRIIFGGALIDANRLIDGALQGIDIRQGQRGVNVLGIELEGVLKGRGGLRQIFGGEAKVAEDQVKGAGRRGFSDLGLGVGEGLGGILTMDVDVNDSLQGVARGWIAVQCLLEKVERIVRALLDSPQIP